MRSGFGNDSSTERAPEGEGGAGGAFISPYRIDCRYLPGVTPTWSRNRRVQWL